MINHKQREILAAFRRELTAEDIMHEGDSIGTDDETLLCVSISTLLCLAIQPWRLHPGDSCVRGTIISGTPKR
jgi:hypothetical protein